MSVPASQASPASLSQNNAARALTSDSVYLRLVELSLGTSRDVTLGELVTHKSTDAPPQDRYDHGGLLMGRRTTTEFPSGFHSRVLSRSHVQFLVDGKGKVFIVDLGSAHGSRILREQSPQISLHANIPFQVRESDLIILGKSMDSADGVTHLPIKFNVYFENKATDNPVVSPPPVKFATLDDIPGINDYINPTKGNSRPAHRYGLSPSVLYESEDEVELPRGSGPRSTSPSDDANSIVFLSSQTTRGPQIQHATCPTNLPEISIPDLPMRSPFDPLEMMPRSPSPLRAPLTRGISPRLLTSVSAPRAPTPSSPLASSSHRASPEPPKLFKSQTSVPAMLTLSPSPQPSRSQSPAVRQPAAPKESGPNDKPKDDLEDDAPSDYPLYQDAIRPSSQLFVDFNVFEDDLEELGEEEGSNVDTEYEDDFESSSEGGSSQHRCCLPGCDCEDVNDDHDEDEEGLSDPESDADGLKPPVQWRENNILDFSVPSIQTPMTVKAELPNEPESVAAPIPAPASIATHAKGNVEKATSQTDDEDIAPQASMEFATAMESINNANLVSDEQSSCAAEVPRLSEAPYEEFLESDDDSDFKSVDSEPDFDYESDSASEVGFCDSDEVVITKIMDMLHHVRGGAAAEHDVLQEVAARRMLGARSFDELEYLQWKAEREREPEAKDAPHTAMDALVEAAQQANAAQIAMAKEELASVTVAVSETGAVAGTPVRTLADETQSFYDQPMSFPPSPPLSDASGSAPKLFQSREVVYDSVPATQQAPATPPSPATALPSQLAASTVLLKRSHDDMEGESVDSSPKAEGDRPVAPAPKRRRLMQNAKTVLSSMAVGVALGGIGTIAALLQFAEE